MTLFDWNKVLAHADRCVENLRASGYDAKAKSYTMYDGKQGIYLQLFDAHGSFFTEYASGIHNTVFDYVVALDNLVSRIKKNV